MLAIFLLLLQVANGGNLREGLVALKRGDLVGARAELEAAARQEPASAIVWAALARVYLRLGLEAEARTSAKRAEEAGGDDPPIQHALSMFYESIGEWAKAADLEALYASGSASDAAVFARAAGMYLKAGKVDDAIHFATAGLQKPGAAAQLHWVFALASDSKKLTAQALSEYRQAAKADPANEEYRFGFVQAMLRAEKFGDAALYLESVETAQPLHAQDRLALGVAYYGLRRFNEAIEALLQTAQLAPDAEQPYLFLGRMLDQAGSRLAEIQKGFERYRAANPDSAAGALLLAKAILQADPASPEIEPLLREAIAKQPSEWEAHSLLADALLRKRDFTGAADQLQTAAKSNPTESSIPFRLARAYDRLQQPSLAAEQRALHQKLLSRPKGMEQAKP